MSGTQSNEPLLLIMGLGLYGGIHGVSGRQDYQKALLELLQDRFGNRRYVIKPAGENENGHFVVQVLGEIVGQTDRRFTFEIQGEQ